MDLIVHICSVAEWRAAQSIGEYYADSLAREGFIHFSKPEQAVDTANRYYAGRGDLLLLWVNVETLTAELRWECSHGEIYPHLYGPLNLEAVLGVIPYLPEKDGIFRKLPPFDPTGSSSGL